MPPKRHTPEVSEDAIIVRSLALTMPANHRIEPHSHPWHQLVYATDGVVTVTSTTSGAWVVPPHRAAWIAAGFGHELRMTGIVRLRTLYIRPRVSRKTPNTCVVISVTPLLRELILETIRRGMLTQGHPAQRRLAGVLLDQIHATNEAPLRIVYPDDPRARRVAETAHENLSLTVPLRDLANNSGASVRTVERLFRAETGLTFGRWLQRLRTLHALERLAAGDTVTEAGLAVGYENTSAFIAMFKRVLGRTPGKYFQE